MAEKQKKKNNAVINKIAEKQKKNSFKKKWRKL